MIRPDRMSQVSVTAGLAHAPRVIETIHDLQLAQLTAYDDSWEGFAPGDPLPAAERLAEELVLVRALEQTLSIDRSTPPPRTATETDIEELREAVNRLDDRRGALRQQLNALRDRIAALGPFVALGIDLDLLGGYRSVSVIAGEGDAAAVRAALADAAAIEAFELFTGEQRTLAVVARTSDGTDTVRTITDELVGVEFAAFEMPEGEAPPRELRASLRTDRDGLERELRDIEEELQVLSERHGRALLAREEELTIALEKAEAPLSFATTDNAFTAELWVRTEDVGRLRGALRSAVGDHAAVEELRAVAHDPRSDEDEQTESDLVVMDQETPPTVQDNPPAVRPFEVLVQAVSRPRYTEFDPTVVLFLTFPAFFGFMIGDVGYGLIYTAIGVFLFTRFPDQAAVRSMGGVTITAGVFTIGFGILYGEIFGLHTIAEVLWYDIVGLSGAPIEKGLSPATADWAVGWLVVSVLAGVMHLNIGWIIDFIERTQAHDLREAVLESGSWLLMMNGLWVWIFSDALRGVAPAFLYTTFSSQGVLPIGFEGFPLLQLFTIPVIDAPMTLPLAVFVLGLILLARASLIEVVEFLNVLVNVLSYTRLAAVLLAKAGMAFVVNLLFFGVYVTESAAGDEWHFGVGYMPKVGDLSHGHEVTEIMFGGLLHGGAAAIVVGVLVLVLGHLLVLILGVTSAGLQAIRLEYVEFFNKFYRGGGRRFEPFGRDREFTAAD
jgi:V/A-type H+-transporting ATPase subunit I